MKVKSILANEKYSYPVQFYSSSNEEGVKAFFNKVITKAVPVPLVMASLETQQIDENTKEQTVQELVAQITELRENKQDTGSPIGFLIDSNQIGQNDAETESSLIAAAHTALNDSNVEVAVALIPLNEQDPENDYEETVQQQVYENEEYILETSRSLESFGCKVFRDKKSYRQYLYSL